MKHRHKIKTYLAFPFCKGEGCEKPSRQRGIAILIAMMTVMIMMSLVVNIIVSSAVNVQLAMTTRDRVKSEYLAKSGLNLGIFLSSLSWGWSLFQAQPKSPVGVKPLQDDASSIWAAVNSFPPIGSYLIDLLAKGKKFSENEGDQKDPFNLRSIFSEKIASQMRLFEDQFSVEISDESAKINVNACYTGRCTQTIRQLIALFSCPAERLFLEEKNLTPEELAYRIKDFITDSTEASPESGIGDLNAPYQQFDPPYNAKGRPFDTIDELKLVDGWDDQIHKVFSDYITVYPYPSSGREFTPTMNLNTMDTGFLSCLVPESHSHACLRNFVLTLHKLKKEKKPLVSGSIDDFLSKTACENSGRDSSGRKKDIASWFDIKTFVLRINVVANTRDQKRTLTAIIRRIPPKDKQFGRPKQDVKRSYQILNWKLI